jgi:D-alanyl-D-alanine carboxypeptidase
MMMKFFNKAVLTICLTAVVSCSGGDNRVQISEPTLKPILQAKLLVVAQRVVAETGTPAVTVHVSSPTYGEFSIAAGLADINQQIPVIKNQPFRIGSLTKSFTAAAVLKLVEEGLVDLDTPISDYLGLVNNYAPLGDVSVRQLLNMNSGVPNYLDLDYLFETIMPNPTEPLLATDLLQHAFDLSPTLLFTPGTEFNYSNSNYILLGMLIERVSGIGYAEYLQQTFIEPLGLNKTIVALDNTGPDDLVRGYYDYNEDGTYEDWTDMHMSFVWSAGCLISTAEDIAIWMEHLATGNLFSETVAK